MFGKEWSLPQYFIVLPYIEQNQKKDRKHEGSNLGWGLRHEAAAVHVLYPKADAPTWQQATS